MRAIDSDRLLVTQSGRSSFTGIMRISSRLLALAVLLIIATSCAIKPPEDGFGSLVATATHADTGNPFAGVLIAVSVPRYYGRHPTLAGGEVTLEEVPAGNWLVEAHCPSTTGVGREILSDLIVITPQSLTQIDVIVPVGFCDEPEYSERPVVVAGHYMRGFETSNFAPCDLNGLNLSKNTFFDPPPIWVKFSNGAGSEIDFDVLFLIEARGTLRGPGRFGHMGVSAYELLIDEVLTSERVNEPDCGNTDLQ